MKIIVLLTDLFDAIGGIQTFNRSLVKALDEIAERRHWKVSLLVLNDSGTNTLTGKYFDPARTAYIGFDGSKSAFIRESLRQSKSASTVLLGHVNFLPVLIGLRACNRRLHSLLAIYGTDVWARLPRLQRLGLRKVDRVLSISESTRQKLAAANNLNGTPVDILPCTLEPFYAQDVRLKSRLDLGLPSGKMILSTSRLDSLERYKGIEDVIAALPTVLAQVPDAFYVVVGDGTDRRRLEKAAEDAGVASRVKFVGRIGDDLLPSYYQACDVFVLPSLREGFGIVFLEAMYYGKACVGAHAGAIPEVIDEGITGLMSLPNDVASLAGALNSILLNDELRESMGRAGKARLTEEFSFTKFSLRLESAVFPNHAAMLNQNELGHR